MGKKSRLEAHEYILPELKDKIVKLEAKVKDLESENYTLRKKLQKF